MADGSPNGQARLGRPTLERSGRLLPLPMEAAGVGLA
jgi:hypothetical protein